VKLTGNIGNPVGNIRCDLREDLKYTVPTEFHMEPLMVVVQCHFRVLHICICIWNLFSTANYRTFLRTLQINAGTLSGPTWK